MGLLSMLVGLPFAPVRGVIALGELVEEQVDRELSAPSAIRRDLEDADDAAAAGAISDEDRAEVQRRVALRAVRARGIDTGAG